MSLFERITGKQEPEVVKVEENPRVAQARALVKRSDMINDEIRKCKNALYVLGYAKEHIDDINIQITIPTDRRTMGGMYSGFIDRLTYDVPIEKNCKLKNLLEYAEEDYNNQLMLLEHELKTL